MQIKESMLSDYQKKIAQDLNMKFYLEKGRRLTKVRRVLEFQQFAWIKPYIDLNTSLRQQATNKFEEEFAKLMNNSFFGK